MTETHTEFCRCGEHADFRCTDRQVGEARTEQRRGQTVVVQPYRTYYLCAACMKAEIQGHTPPRGVSALAHHAALLRQQQRDAERAQLGSVEQDRLGDWGRP